MKYGQFILLYQWAAIFPYLVFDRPWYRARKEKALLSESVDTPPSEKTPEGESITESSTSSEAPIPFDSLDVDPFYGFPFWEKLWYQILVPAVDQPVPFVGHLLAFGILVHSLYCLSEYNHQVVKNDVESVEPAAEIHSEPINVLPSFIEESIQLKGYLNPILFDSIAQVFY